jgi:hypothetical protein
MTAKTKAAEQPFTIVLDDDDSAVAEGRLRDLDAGPTWAKNRVQISLDEGDTSGHALDATAVSVNLRFDDDVEGHALSLHFPTAEKADEFRKRLIATGVVAGALVVGVTAAQLSSAIPAPNSITAPAPNAAPVPMVIQEGTQFISAAPVPMVVQESNQFLAPAQPATNPNIPAEDIAPKGATTPKLSSSHIVQSTDAATPNQVRDAARHAAQKAANDETTLTPAQRHAQEHK